MLEVSWASTWRIPALGFESQDSGVQKERQTEGRVLALPLLGRVFENSAGRGASLNDCCESEWCVAEPVFSGTGRSSSVFASL